MASNSTSEPSIEMTPINTSLEVDFNTWKSINREQVAAETKIDSNRDNHVRIYVLKKVKQVFEGKKATSQHSNAFVPVTHQRNPYKPKSKPESRPKPAKIDSEADSIKSTAIIQSPPEKVYIVTPVYNN
jgi:hypothetical protein